MAFVVVVQDMLYHKKGDDPDAPLGEATFPSQLNVWVNDNGGAIHATVHVDVKQVSPAPAPAAMALGRPRPPSAAEGVG